MLDLKEDIEGARKVGKHGCVIKENEKYFDKYGKIYPFNNEELNTYYKDFNYDGPVLCVASSADHLLHAILQGATDITLFDINRLTKYYCMLKLAGIKTLSYKEFFDYFKVTSEKLNLVNVELYKKVRRVLQAEDRCFWDDVISDGLTVNNFYNGIFDVEPVNNAYYDEDVYYDLQSKSLSIKPPKFIETDVFDLPKKLSANDKFSSIFLSNISDYVDGQEFEKLLVTLVKNNLLEGGLIQTNYFTDYDNLGLKLTFLESTNAVVKSIK